MNDQSETHELNNSNVEGVIFFNELEAIVKRVATEKNIIYSYYLVMVLVLKRLGVYLVLKKQELSKCLIDCWISCHDCTKGKYSHVLAPFL